ncbi:hypothetical protein CLV58_106255 [Spirosoma oryzae]|uniref:Uncharacterized protein n=1 Tax=Spirosoma oryzae TaxID=1469603 RepID=A0A2T0T5X0_9BACT|nr:hypothetical protein [Spirosoma oryzae]PRY41068.1 hypothetical protein CLV58_106255 [Spirosoma oryzae]
MKRVYLPLLLLWLIPVVIAQLLIGFVSASPASTGNAQPQLRFLLQANDASCTVEVAADGTVSGLLTLGEDRWTK